LYEIKTHEQRFTELFRRYYRDVYHFLLCFTGNKSDAEDLTQEVFLAAVCGLAAFEGRSQMKTWLLGIAKNKARAWYQKKRITALFTDLLSKNLITKEGLPDRELINKEGAKELFYALQKLKSQYRMVFILRCIKEYSIKETAEILQCSEAKIKVDYHRACKMLQDHLQPSWKGEWKNALQE
jgi:RNA polymerase sigma-70 factor (ECF subfamily)